MQISDTGLMRLNNLHVHGGGCTTIPALMEHLGAVQAQDYAMACWALGVRLPGLTQTDVEDAVLKSAIVRTHVLRPTWHFIPADDASWMVAFSSVRIHGAIRSYDKMHGIIPEETHRHLSAVRQMLAGGKALSRETIALGLTDRGMSLEGPLLSHLLMRAEQDRVVCNGLHSRGKPTYRLMEECVSFAKVLNHEEAAAELASRYFTSHGPAQVEDFSWWSGLPLGASRRALAAVAGNLQQYTVQGKTYWTGSYVSPATHAADGVFLLPAFDEFLVGYRDRSDVLPPGLNSSVISVNGIFRPVVVSGGQVIGTWSRSVKKEQVQVEVALFVAATSRLKEEIAQAAEAFGKFLTKQVALTFTDNFK